MFKFKKKFKGIRHVYELNRLIYYLPQNDKLILISNKGEKQSIRFWWKRKAFRLSYNVFNGDIFVEEILGLFLGETEHLERSDYAILIEALLRVCFKENVTSFFTDLSGNLQKCTC
jgi:hypothetical protein